MFYSMVLPVCQAGAYPLPAKQTLLFHVSCISGLSAYQLARVSMTCPRAFRTSIFTAMLPSSLCVAQDRHGS